MPTVIAGRVRLLEMPEEAGSVSRDWQQAEVQAERLDEQEREPERRHCEADRRDDADAVIGRSVAVEGREDAERHRDEQRDDRAVDEQEDARPDTRADDVPHRLLEVDRRAEVAAWEPGEERAELLGERLVEAELVADALHRFRRRVRAQRDPHRVARHEMDE